MGCMSSTAPLPHHDPMPTLPAGGGAHGETLTPASGRGHLGALLTAPAFALQFLTVAPPIVRRVPRLPELGAAEAFFPATGMVLGLCLVGADLLLAQVVAPIVRDMLLVALLAAMTGALHLDGVVDTFDGLFASGGPEARLAIMRDPRAGTFGVVGVVALLGLKVAAVGALLPELRMPALILAPCLGRWAIVQSTWLFRYARPQGLGRAFKDAVRPAHAIAAGVSAILLAALLLGWPGIAIFGIASACALGVGVFAAGRLNGLSGDTYGAVCEWTEVVVLLICGSRMLAHAA